MATHFSLTIVHGDAMEATQAAQAVWEDVDRLEQELSRYIPQSDVSAINTSAAGQAVDVHEATMDCLLYARDVWAATEGAFDVTVGPLCSLLRRAEGLGCKPDPHDLAAARAATGMDKLRLEAEEFLITTMVTGMSVDLGAIGKGYALDQAAILLREAYGITNAFLNAGTSTLLGVGAMPGQDGWLVRAGDPDPFLLQNNAVSGTGFAVKGAHIIDPRKAKLVDVRRLIRWSVAPNATLADALSTAFMVMSKSEIAAFCRKVPESRCIFVEK